MGAPDLSRESWLALRKQSIGASEAAAACGEDPSVSPAELVCRKRGDLPEADLSDIEAIFWGNRLEPVIVQEIASRAGLKLLERRDIENVFERDEHTELVGFVDGAHPFLRSRARPWQTATLDGIGHDAALDQFVEIEAKNAGRYHSAAWSSEDERAPDKFRLQVAHQLAVAPRMASGILGGLVGGNSLRTVRLERVKIAVMIEALVEIEGSVWECVTSGTLPGLSGPSASVARALKALHPDDDGSSVILDEETAAIATALQHLKATQKATENTIEDLSNRLRAALGNATFGQMPDGSGVYSLKTQERAEHIVPASKFRVLRFSKPKSRNPK